MTADDACEVDTGPGICSVPRGVPRERRDTRETCVAESDGNAWLLGMPEEEALAAIRAGVVASPDGVFRVPGYGTDSGAWVSAAAARLGRRLLLAAGQTVGRGTWARVTVDQFRR